MDTTPTILLPSVDPTRVGGWIQTFTGRCFWPMDPRVAEVNILDIAHALSNKCRYQGHSTRFYSVAEHSVLVSQFVSAEQALWGLLHDAAEAYLADVPSPVKASLTGFDAIEANIMTVICQKFGLSPTQPDEVAQVDAAMISDEKKVLMDPTCPRDWGTLPAKLGANVQGLAPEAAKALFLARFVKLY